jgi:ABC-2 type transport system ATP-binding protein
MNQLALQADALTRKYQRRLVVDHLSLSVERGDVFGFLGQNGAGKSTTIRHGLGLGAANFRSHRSTRTRYGSPTTRSVEARRRDHRSARLFTRTSQGQQNLRMLAAMSGGATRAQLKECLS